MTPTSPSFKVLLIATVMMALTKMTVAGAAVIASTNDDKDTPTSRRRSLQSGVDLATCTFNSTGNFNIQLMDMGSSGSDDSQFVEIFAKAAERWQKVIVNDLPDFRAGAVDDWFNGAFDRPYNGPVDDVIIGYDISSTIDGLGGTLGRAGGTFVRTARGVATTTISGTMQFDRTDLEQMPIDDVKAVILHEMGHVLGLVGVNGGCSSACDPNQETVQGVYQCPIAAREFQAWAPEQLVLENSGGMGTACSHWDESVFKTGESSELMTGFFEENLFQPLSRVTVAALEDIGGYEVDYCGADIWPADENTVQPFEVYRTKKTMDMSTMMEDLYPMMGMDEDGKPYPMSAAAASLCSESVISTALLMSLVLGILVA